MELFMGLRQALEAQRDRIAEQLEALQEAERAMEQLAVAFGVKIATTIQEHPSPPEDGLVAQPATALTHEPELLACENCGKEFPRRSGRGALALGGVRRRAAWRRGLRLRTSAGARR
jgi:hypothetical protein